MDNLRLRENAEIKNGGFGFGQFRGLYVNDKHCDNDKDGERNQNKACEEEDVVSKDLCLYVDCVDFESIVKGEAGPNVEKSGDDTPKNKDTPAYEPQQTQLVVEGVEDRELKEQLEVSTCLARMRHMEMFMGSREKNWECANLHKEKVIKELKDIEKNSRK
ncbi:hypothetical protein L1987_00744 [Smallanthus sonchifolius]|uniref:Uncharacterized protein n=1 Tax=Smallanthus sonchifolius TaxID=185202 RepID=A0ACB9K364_9ASTR|nr:hypothetical protein L1987_00744 [Smallanthus sonchifolius]